MTDTIFALSSGHPPAALAIVRISGPDASAAARALGAKSLTPRRAQLTRLRSPADGALLDEAIVLLFPGPASSTGEDVVELHLHGGRATVRAVEAALGAMPSLLRAEPGEFTRRALANGRLGLNEAEALADLLSAETESQRLAAVGRLDGALDRAIAGWRRDLLAIAAQVEAALDHDEEGDVAASEGSVRESIATLTVAISDWRSAPSAERIRDGIRVVLAGPPNAGKSSLFNALCGREAAIVDASAGTTRDLIEAPLAIDGVPFVLIDTAGLRDETDSRIEAIGIDRARDATRQADILLWLGDATELPDGAILVASKCDAEACRPGLAVSATTGAGIADLKAMLVEAARELLPRESAVAINERQRTCLAEMAQHLTAALANSDPLIVAEEVRLARQALDRLNGDAGVEDLLDTLFARFCIGK